MWWEISHLKHAAEKMDENEDQAKGRMLYFKKIRKEQKKRRKERRKEEERKEREEGRRKQFDELVGRIRRSLTNGEEPEADPGSLEPFDDEVAVASRKGNNDIEVPADEQADAVPVGSLDLYAQTTDSQVSMEGSNNIEEIAQNSVVKLQNSVASGTFGACYLANYKGMVVAVKELRVRGHSKEDIEKQRKEVLDEATVMLRIGSHRGLPHLFEIQSKVAPFRIIMQFHGIDKKSVTLRRAVTKFQLSNEEWKTVVDLVGSALIYIHSKGVLHNDLKGDNVLLETRESCYNPVVIDFGKSTLIGGPHEKRRHMSTKEQREYALKYPHVAPEIVTGSGVYSVASDTYSFAKVIDFLCDKAGMSLGSAKRVLAKNCALVADPSKRPAIEELIRETSH